MALIRRGAGGYLHERDGSLVLILEDRRPAPGRATIGAVPAWLANLRCFVAPVTASLAEVPKMVRIALEAVAVLDFASPGHKYVRQAWGSGRGRAVGRVRHGAGGEGSRILSAHRADGSRATCRDCHGVHADRVGVVGRAGALLQPQHCAQPVGPYSSAHRVRPRGASGCGDADRGAAAPVVISPRRGGTT